MSNQSGRNLVETQSPVERTLLVGAQLKSQRQGWELEDSLIELGQLARTAGLEVAGQTWQRLDQYHPATLIGSGKVEELVELRDDLDCSVIIFDDELSPRQLRNLEETMGDDVKILDRTSLILDIFAQHARTREGQLQVELAQYQYRLPRLTRAWTHLARQAGGGAARGGTGGVGLRGPGETQLEVDRRLISRRIAQIEDELEQVRRHRALHRRQRRRMALPVVAIVGYTNAGKSTLLNALSGADVLVADKLFATLDPTTRRVELPGGREILFSDTVGFIQKLPTQLVAAFRATLEEINEADLILHVVDITHPRAKDQSDAVVETLEEIGVVDRPTVVALNKIDRLSDPRVAEEWQGEYSESVAISAARGWHLDTLLEKVEEVLSADLLYITVRVPYNRGDLAALFHEHGTVSETKHSAEGTIIKGLVARRWLEQFREYLI
ncbi:MAG: GTPase HflX [Anaerolineae bacterium]|nr:GTPase HflX [Anaerolineae bacterium]